MDHMMMFPINELLDMPVGNVIGASLGLLAVMMLLMHMLTKMPVLGSTRRPSVDEKPL